MSKFFKHLGSKRIAVVGLMGASSGLPLLLVGSTLQAWLTEKNVSLSLIGAATLIGLPYTIKFLWAPFLDKFNPPFLSGRRGWIFTFQLLISLSLFLLSTTRPEVSLWSVAIAAFLVSFFSASQDIVVDAHRRDTLKEDELAVGTSLYVFWYRVALLISGALALFLADHFPWNQVYVFMSILMAAMCLITLKSPSLGDKATQPKTLKEAVIDPFKDYLKRRGAWQMLLFILIYKLGDNMGLAMNISYVLKLGFTKTQYATFAKTFALAALILGGFIGAAVMEKLSMKKSLILFGIFQGISTGAFALLSYTGVNNAALATLMTLEHLSYGMGGAVFSTFILALTNRKYSGTQYALLTSLTGVPRVIFSAYTGVLATEMGWVAFYVFCGAMSIPGLLLLTQFDKWQKESV